ncbi:uncharacterized protein LOC127733558 [Mytilus californianus]|uniref:uncharacterized protein LOC127733558 n=1 Tax=Mytilus californianus TaxID=6549 RepID=UPI002246AB3C|nr:uncharacterized protein LOC127733558 [Mytilus californianus]
MAHYQRLLLLVLSCVYGISYCSHQGWWRKHHGWWKKPNCNCSDHHDHSDHSTSTPKPMSEIVRTMFPGLLINSNDLTKLPVIKPEGTRRTHETSYVGNIIPNSKTVLDSCCQTEFAYEVINTTVSNKRNLKVVHFENAFQFVPTGKCPENATCGRNTCVQMYRHQWLLIWDDHLPHYPPVTFAAVEVPSHCECVNVGT